MTSHYTRGSVTTLHEFGSVLERHLDAFFWALTISWSRLLAHVWSGPSRLSKWHLRNTKLLLKGCLHHGPWSCSMSHGIFPWPCFYGLIVNEHTFKAFGSMTRCKLNMDQEKWPCTKTWMCYFSKHMSKKGNFGNYFHVWPSPLYLHFFPCNYENV